MCTSVVLFSRQDYNLAEILKFVCRDNRTNLSFCRTLADLVYFGVYSMPEVVVHDDESIKFNYKIYSDFKDSQKFNMPLYVVLTHDTNAYMYYDDIVVIKKEDYASHLSKIIKSVKEKETERLTERRRLEINERLNVCLKDFGITTKYLGFGYIKDLVFHIIEDKRNLKSFNTKLYPQLASKYNTQVSNIERNVRNAISVAIQSPKDSKSFSEFLSYINAKNNKAPSNKQFVSFLAEKVAY